jgi:transposase
LAKWKDDQVGSPRKFSPEFRAQCVREVVERSRTVAEVAREFGVGPETLRNWVKAFRRESPDAVPAVSESVRAELERLRKENRELRAEREFLGKAAAFFAKGFR